MNSNLDFDGFGACEGTLTCSTCHLIFSQPDFDKLPDKPSDDELDMLDLAYDLTDTSRLGCQIYLSKDMNGMEVKVRELNLRFHLFIHFVSLFYRFQQPSTMQGRNSRSLRSLSIQTGQVEGQIKALFDPNQNLLLSSKMPQFFCYKIKNRTK